MVTASNKENIIKIPFKATKKDMAMNNAHERQQVGLRVRTQTGKELAFNLFGHQGGAYFREHIFSTNFFSWEALM